MEATLARVAEMQPQPTQVSKPRDHAQISPADGGGCSVLSRQGRIVD